MVLLLVLFHSPIIVHTMLLKFLILLVFVSFGAAQTLLNPAKLLGDAIKDGPKPPFPRIPTPNEFLENLFNETTSEILTMTKNFYFRDVRTQDLNFLLHNKNGSYDKIDEDSVNKINAKEPIKIIIHGWQSEGDASFIKRFVNSYAKIGITNVLSLDWTKHSKKNYIHAASSTMNIGKILGDFILKIVNKDEKLLKNIHLIGHSLGAHIAGFAGKRVKKELKTKVGRITALDSAAPIFEFPIKMLPELRLSGDDADYVDGIHTNAGFFGFLGPVGTADFYINNGGPLQPGCLEVNIVDTFFCSHSMSHDIFIESITTKRMKATACPNVALFRTRLCDLNVKVVMGEHASTKADGTFFFDK
ncbi:phospholipase A1 4 isoform X2 [Aethina tumida]|uniref:phospholipase A1 4 isoform X2 n=1 Tax=Aethina tumida TaxID=116153 RepID=UPI00214735F0|nr:phospholipase A1 4 isoform X2 [Aethina tumida]